MHLRERLGSEKLKLMHVLVHRQQRQVAARHCHLLSSPAAAGSYSAAASASAAAAVLFSYYIMPDTWWLLISLFSFFTFIACWNTVSF